MKAAAEAEAFASPATFSRRAYTFLWQPKEWDRWWYHSKRTDIRPQDRVSAKVEQADGSTIIVHGVVLACGDANDDDVKDALLDVKDGKSVKILYPDPESHAFCCKIQLEADVSLEDVELAVPIGFARGAEAVILFLIALNILTFILGTLSEFGQGTSWDSAFDVLEYVSVSIFTLEYIARLYACVEHVEPRTNERPFAVTQNPCLTGDDVRPELDGTKCIFWGRVLYVFTDFYAIMDLAAILPFYVDLALVSVDLVPTTFLRALRLLRLLKADREADMLSKFDDVFYEIKPALVATGYVGGVFWILAATAMYYCERNNEDVGGRMSSIPNAMYYTMQMLMGEFVLNNEFTVPGKVVATCIAIFGAIFFSIPVGLFGGAFLSLAAGGDDEDEDEDGEVGDGEMKADDTKNEGADNIDQNERRAWATVTNSSNLISRCRAYSCYVMSAYGFLGQALKYVTFFLVGTCVITLILVTVPKVQKSSGFQSLDFALEMISISIFSVEYLLRVWCVVDSFDERSGKKEYDGCRGRASFIFSFFGLVDLLSFMPTVIYLGLGEQTSNWHYSRIFRLVRILKVERFMPAFTLFDNVFASQRTILFGLGYTVLVLWLVFSCLMYLVERDHKPTAPDDDIIEHPYSNMLESMWYTLLNITGEFPLGDYSIGGKFIGFFMVIFAIELYGAASGVFAEGFQNAVENRGTKKDVW